MDRSRVAIIIPALNEAKSIQKVVERVRAHATVVVVDDGSTDDTAAIARRMGAQVVSHQVNRGYDAALNSGFAWAAELGFPILMTMDADGQHDPAAIERFMENIDAGADVVIGIRPRCQRVAEYIFSWVSVRKWGIRDPLCGMKAYRMEVYRRLGHFDSYGSVGTELALSAARFGSRIAQIPISIADRSDPPRFDRRWRANFRILRALWQAL